MEGERFGVEFSFYDFSYTIITQILLLIYISVRVLRGRFSVDINENCLVSSAVLGGTYFAVTTVMSFPVTIFAAVLEMYFPYYY
jgi:hypothetical protein